MTFADRVSVVTGGASGIGRAIAELLVADGAKTYVLDLTTEGAPAGATALRVDVADHDGMAAAFDHVVGAHGRIDALFNNAGIVTHTDIVSATVEEFDHVMGVNARGVFIGMKLALPHMLAARTGAIVNSASAAALIGLRERAAYSASKGAVVALTRQAAVEYAGRGVRINCICPGTTDGPIIQEMLKRAPDADAVRSLLEGRQPIGRIADPREIASAALFLASDHASFITGVALQVDGGWTSL